MKKKLEHDMETGVMRGCILHWTIRIVMEVCFDYTIPARHPHGK